MDNHTQALVTVPPHQTELPADLDVFRVGEILAKSGYFTDVKDMAQAVAKILAGREMGFGPIASLTGVYIQNGRPCYSANMIAAAVKKSRRYDYRVKQLDAQICEIEFYEGGKTVGVSSFTVKDAEQAGLTIGKNAHSWKHYPRNMLFARALTNGARFYCPDTFGGIPVYTPEEMDMEVDGESGEAIKSVAIASPRQPERPLTMAPKPQSAQSEAPAPALPQAQPVIDRPLKTVAVLEAKQLQRVVITQQECGVSDDVFKAYLTERFGIMSRKLIPATAIDEVLAWLKLPPAGEEFPETDDAREVV